MKIFKFIIPVLLVLLPMKSICEEENYSPGARPRVSELHVGDKMPDVWLISLLNAPKKAGKLSESVKGRAVILDFFATWCGSCIKELPVLDRFQKMFSDKLAALVISGETVEKVSSFLHRNDNMNGIGLPFLTDDYEIAKMFPHVEIPHEVWINKEGIIVAITSAEELTKQNIQDFLDNKLKDLPVKTDLMNFIADSALFKNGNGGDGNVYLTRSILTKALKGADSPELYMPDSNGDVKRIASINHPPLQMFFMAYSQLQMMLNYKRIVLQTKDSIELKRINKIHDQDEYYKYCYIYEYIPVKPEKREEAFQHMLEDLNRYFTIYATIEKRRVSCWILIKPDKSIDLLKSKGGEIKYATDGSLLRNCKLDNLVACLNMYNQMEPVVDETGYNNPVDLDLEKDGNITFNKYPNIESMRKNLNRYGLDLVKGMRDVDVLVIKDKK